MATLFRWIHLSDIHWTPGTGRSASDQRLLLEQLLSDIIRNAKNRRLAPDAVFITGDLADTGDATSQAGPLEYGLATEWLLQLTESLGLKNEKVVIVPGNHDVFRGDQNDRNLKRLLNSLRDGGDSLDDALADATDRATLTRRFRSFLAFSLNYAPLVGDSDRLFGTCLTSNRKKTFTVKIVALNTSLLALGSDQGRMQLGKRQLLCCSGEGHDDRKHPVIVLTHHPLDWLRDGNEAREWIQRLADVHLLGHTHEPDSVSLKSPTGSLVRITSGASHDPHSAEEVYGYNFASILRKGERTLVRVWPRAWSSKRKQFGPDMNNVDDGKDYADYQLTWNWKAVTEKRRYSSPAAPFDDADFYLQA